MKANELIPEIKNLVGKAREDKVREFIKKNYIPSFLSIHHSVILHSSTSENGSKNHVLELLVAPEFFCIGEDDDYLLLPLNPKTLTEEYLRPNRYVLPTATMAKKIYEAAELKLPAHTISPNSQKTDLFLEINEKILQDKAATKDSLLKLCAGHKKDVVLSNMLNSKDKRGNVGLYGWFGKSGKPIQPLYCGHTAEYVDYSHGLRPVSDACVLDDEAVSLTRDIFPDPELSLLVHDEILKFTSY